MFPLFLASILLIAVGSPVSAAINALIIDGQNNHDWKATTPVLKAILQESNLFTVDVATAPKDAEQLKNFHPPLKRYRVIISNYNGDSWSPEFQQSFVEFVRNGGGFVSVHAANNSFPEWTEYNEMIGVGGWGGRTEKHGPYLRLRDGKFVPEKSPGAGGSHGAQHAFLIQTRDANHPIMAGLPTAWMHEKDELYDRLRGPAKNVTVLASAFSAKETKGSGEEEPLLLAISFGKGRVFHTALGHSVPAMKCVGFSTTFLRGTEWAATGKVTTKMPADFPAKTEVSLRP